ncbi:FAR-RED impaired response 1-like protein [Tanacetum coccineum]|uniref:FAR-RED impaired response 1-like protein n=1 Tax=Tanacetum coccineum TaxID=301880 RepID=A0ABQ5FIU6_9ASTR
MELARHSSYSNYETCAPNLFPDLNEEPARHNSLQDVRGDGNCGFRSVAVALGLSEDQWPRIRSDLVRELEANHQNYKYIFGTAGYKQIYKTVRFAGKWMEMPNTGLIIAFAYNRVVISLANGGNVRGCTTTFPLWSSPPQSEPHETIVIAHVYGNHYIKAALREGCPLPMTHPLWRTYRSDIASRWEDPYVSRQEVFREHYYRIPEFFDLSK